MSDRIEFIRNLDIDPKATGGHENVEKIMSFSDDISSQGKADVLNSLLLAQLAADTQYDQLKERDEWYQYYVTVMSKMGYIIDNFHFGKYQTTSPELALSSAIISTAEAYLTKDQIAIIQKSLDARRKPEKKNSGSGGPSVTRGVHVIFSYESSGQVKTFMTFLYCTVLDEQNYIFHAYKVADMNPIISKQLTATLNGEVYSKVRQAVSNKLAEEAKDVVGDLPI